MSFPQEVRYMIPTTCIKPTRVQPETDTDEFDDEPNAPWGCYLSRTMPPPLFQVSHQIREEAFRALAACPDLTAICNNGTGGETEG